MGDGNKKWIIREASGRIVGPFTTEKVLYKIGRGELSGDEAISHYPGGKWIPITQDPQFYDKLLDILAVNPRGGVEETTEIFEQTQAFSQDSAADTGEDEFAFAKHSVAREKAPIDSGADTDPHLTQTRSRVDDIELIDTRPEIWRGILKRAKIPALVGGVALTLAAVLYWSDEPPVERIHLLAPQRGLSQLEASALSDRKKQGATAFVEDTFQSYLRSQNEFVHIVERNNKDAESMALLCLTYLQLWPYSHQDSSDSRALATVVQMSSAVDPAGLHSATCRAVDLIVRSRFPEAMSLVDSVLETRASSHPPIIFYFLKGLLYAGGTEHSAAVGYLQSSQQLWPQWVLPYSLEASVQARLEQYSEAANLYRRILQTNSEHTVSRIELGLLEYKHFNQIEQAERNLHQAIDHGRAPSGLVSRAYFGLAEIHLKRGDQKGALKYAQKSFSLNSGNTPAKNLIVQLGGIEKLRGTKVKGQQLVFEGDQFFREGDCAAAQAHFKAAFEEDPKNAMAALKAARCLWQLSLSTEAVDWLNKAIRSDSKLLEAYVLMADYQSQRYNFQAAGRVLETAYRVNPKSYEVLRGFAMVELRRGNASGALTYGRRALALYEHDVETQILLSQISLNLRDFKMAYNYAAKAVEIDINHRKAQITYAQALAGLQGVDVGLDYMMKLVGNYSHVMEYRLALGKMLLSDERYRQAEEVYRQVIKLDEKPKEAYVELAKAIWAESRQPEALRLLLKAAVLDPADAEPLFVSGTIYLEMLRPAEARLQFTRVLTINKLYPRVQYQLGRAALMLNDPKEALAATEREKLANPNLADAYLLAAEAHTLLQQYSSCASEYQKAIKLRPQQATIYIRLAQCYRKRGDLEAAAAMLNVAASQESGIPDIYKEQGAIFESKGDLVRAIAAYQQYFVLNPEAADRQLIEDRISALQRGQRP